jgi:hypothetical protein
MESVNLKCEDLHRHSLPGFADLYIVPKSRAFNLSGWLALNSSINQLGYCAVFLESPSSLEALSANLEWVREYYGQESEDEQTDSKSSSNLFLNSRTHRSNIDMAAGNGTLVQSPPPPPPSPSPSPASCHSAAESLLASGQAESAIGCSGADDKGRFLALLADMAAASHGPERSSNVSDSEGKIDFTETLRFLAGESLTFSPEAIEQVAQKLEELEAVELTPRLRSLRESGLIPAVPDYEHASGELDLARWLALRQDQVLETGPASSGVYSPTAAWSQQDWPENNSADELVARCDQLLIVPVARSELVPAFFHFGGYSGTPPAHVHLAALQHWKARYAPKLLAIDHDSLAFFVGKPACADDVQALALEHFRYCPDRVTRAAGSLDYLARALVGADVWQFTWG